MVFSAFLGNYKLQIFCNFFCNEIFFCVIYLCERSKDSKGEMMIQTENIFEREDSVLKFKMNAGQKITLTY